MERARRTKLTSSAIPAYSKGEVARLTSAKPSQIDYWVKSGLIRPDLPSSGRGDHRGFTFRNLVEITIAALLSAKGPRDRSSWDAVRAIRRRAEEDWESNRPDLVRALAEAKADRDREIARMTTEQIRDHDARLATLAETIRPLDARLADILCGKDVAEFETESDRAEWDAELEAWRRFKNPAQRKASDRWYLCSVGENLWLVVDDPLFAAARLPMFQVLNLRVIFENLERATGDRWRGWSELQGIEHGA